MSGLPTPVQPPARPFTTSAGRQAGITDRMLSGRRFVRVVHGVHDAAEPTSFPERERVLRLLRGIQLVRSDSVASCLAAAMLYGLPVPAHPIDVHVTAVTLLSRPQVVAHRRALDDAREVEGVRLTSPVQTFLDLAAELRPPWLLAIGDALARFGLVSGPELVEAAAAGPPRRGIRNARRIAPLVRAGSESPMESLLRLAIIEAKLPEPVANGQARDHHDNWLARVDLSYPTLRVAVEYQGDHHRSDAKQWRADISRTRALQAAGWLVIFATAEDLGTPGPLLRSIRRALYERGWRPETAD
jgi:very-short-patch-repair endonuclease